MGDFDLTLRRLAARRPEDIACLVLGETFREATASDTALQAMRREADAACIVETASGLRFVFHVEFEPEPSQDIGGRVLEYHVAFHRREGLPVASAVVRATGEARAIAEHRTSAGLLPGAVFRYYEIGLAGFDARGLLDAGRPALAALVPLARGGEREEVLAEALAKIRGAGLDSGLEADLLAAVVALAGLRVGPEVVRALVRREDMMQRSWVLREIAAEVKGKDVLRVLELRFGALPEEVRKAVLAVSTPATELTTVAEGAVEELDRLLALATTAASMEEFTRGLHAPPR